jgi:hypothetical protein
MFEPVRCSFLALCMLEELNRPLVFRRCTSGFERAEVPLLATRGVDLSRVQAKLARFQLTNHTADRWETSCVRFSATLNNVVGLVKSVPVFHSHGDKDLVEAVRRGRRKEFSEFGWSDEIPNPQEESTFAQSRPQPHLRESDPHRVLRLFYQELIRFRRAHHLGMDADLDVAENETLHIVTVLRGRPGPRVLMIFNFDVGDVRLLAVMPAGRWTTQLHSAESRWSGPGAPFPDTVGPADTLTLSGHSFVVLKHEDGA